MTDKVDAAREALQRHFWDRPMMGAALVTVFEAAIRAESHHPDDGHDHSFGCRLCGVDNPAEATVAAQVRLTHRPVTNPMYFEGRPICDHDSQEWPCLTELQVREGLRAALAATPEGER